MKEVQMNKYAFNSKNLSSWINITYVLRQHAELQLLSDLNEPSLIKIESLFMDH